MIRVNFESVALGTVVDAYDHWGLALSSKETGPPQPRVYRVDIEGRNGSVDLSDWTGQTRFQDRMVILSFEFLKPKNMIESTLHAVNNFLLARRVKIRFSDDPLYYYEGRCESIETGVRKHLGRVTATFVCAPYKYRREVTTVIQSIAGTKTIVLTNDRMPVTPTIVTTAPMKIEFSGYTYNLNAGTHRLLGLTLTASATSIVVTGSGTITITYRKGAL